MSFVLPKQCCVFQCRFPNSHTTAGHVCGMCRQRGHGVVECTILSARVDLQDHFEDKVPLGLRCHIGGCEDALHHTTDAHHCPGCDMRASHALMSCPRRPRWVLTAEEDRLDDKHQLVFDPPAAGCPTCRAPVASVGVGIANKMECTICMDDKRLCQLLPCGHATICRECAVKVLC